MIRLDLLAIVCLQTCYRPQRSCGQGYVFTRVCDSVHRGGVSRQGEPPGQGEPPPDQADPPGRENPPRPGRTPPGRENPPGPGRPPPPPPLEADSRIWSTSGRYASYWNAFLLRKQFTHRHTHEHTDTCTHTHTQANNCTHTLTHTYILKGLTSR